MKLPTLDEVKMRHGLEKETSLNRNDGLMFNAVKQGCILLEMSALSNIFSSTKILNSTMQALVEKILTAGQVDTSEKAEIILELCIKSPLTVGKTYTFHYCRFLHFICLNIKQYELWCNHIT